MSIIWKKKIRCPWKYCHLVGMEWHLFVYGISHPYSKWVYQGKEPTNLSRYTRDVTPSHNKLSREFNVNNDEDEILNLRNDLQFPIEEDDVEEEDLGMRCQQMNAKEILPTPSSNCWIKHVISCTQVVQNIFRSIFWWSWCISRWLTIEMINHLICYYNSSK